MRAYTLTDRVLMALDQALRTVHAPPRTTGRPYPAEDIPEVDLTPAERDRAARLMRVDHAGEVAAQGLYQGQALLARDERVREQMLQSSEEENDHLAWCERRLGELGSHTSYLGPFWYAGSYAIGTLASLAGDRWSLGFVKETENQVIEHLEDHLRRLPPQDARSRAILEQMKIDEGHHAYKAHLAGAADLPRPVKALMRLSAKVMTHTAYWV